MVVARRPKHHGTAQKSFLRRWISCLTVTLVLFLMSWAYFGLILVSTESTTKSAESPSSQPLDERFLGCPVTSISDLSAAELFPTVGERHMVLPPGGGNVSLVCCSSTKGNLTLLIHERWAPLGVARFLDMVQAGYFSSRVPLFRCTDACQFGLAGNTSFTKRFNKRLEDDFMWMPPGPDHRQNEAGVKRYPQGFLTFAGSGKNSRSNQLVLTLKPNKFMGGGSPWEVPLGELVGSESFATIRQFYTGYGEKGPSQKILHQEGNSERVQRDWPLMDYITKCDILESKEL